MLGNNFLKSTSFVVFATVLSSMVQGGIGFADKENLDIVSSYSGNLNSLQQVVGDATEAKSLETIVKRRCQLQKLSEVLNMIRTNRQQHDDIEKEKEELKKMYEENMRIINEKRKKNDEDYDNLLRRSNSLKDILGIERDLTFMEKLGVFVRICGNVFLVILFGVPTIIALAAEFSKKENPTVGDGMNEISKFISNCKNKVLNFFGVENS